MSSTNTPQLKDDQVVQLTWKEVKSMQEDLKAYRGLVRMLSRELSAAKKNLNEWKNLAESLHDLSKRQVSAFGDILDTTGESVKKVNGLRDALVSVMCERDALKRQLEERS